MTHLFLKICLLSAFLPLFAGCATNIGVPQTRDEFVTMYKPGGLFRNVEHVTVNRQPKAVVADVKEYARKCLNVRVVSSANYRLKEVGGSTTYHPKVETSRNDAATFSVQEEYNDRPESGAPKGGIFTLVADIRSAGKNKTQVDIYHAGRGKIADPLIEWVNVGKHSCPSL